MISSTIVADSISKQGHRLTTFVLMFPRIVLAEFNTHRMLSKNSASSRAIPFAKMLEKVRTTPFIPIKWMKEHKGMQGTEYFTDPKDIDVLKSLWLSAANSAIQMSERLSKNEVTKQLCNRLLEPFMYHTVIVTGSEFENFFALRAHPQAEIHIADLAEKMLVAYNESTPKSLKEGQWHIPFGEDVSTALTEDLVFKYAKKEVCDIGWHSPFDPSDPKSIKWDKLIDSYKVKIATARCARVSYLNFEGKDDYQADLKLHDTLLDSGHMSPFEHCARAMSDYEHYNWSINTPDAEEMGMGPRQLGWCGNFRGFVQYRKTLSGENKSDNRVMQKKYE